MGGETSPTRMDGGTALDYYESLGVSPNASDAVIRVAYRQRLKEVHPDTGHSNEQEFTAVLEAGAVLLDPDERAIYDRRRNAAAAPVASEPSPPQRSYPVDLPRESAWSSSRIALAGTMALLSLLAILLLTRGSNGDEVLAASFAPSIATDVPAATSVPATAVPATAVPVAAAVPPTPVPATAVPATAVPVATAVPPTPVPPTPAPVATASPASAEDASPDQADADSQADSEAAASDADVGDDEAETVEDDVVERDLPDLADLPERGAIYRAPTLYLVGPVPQPGDRRSVSRKGRSRRRR